MTSGEYNRIREMIESTFRQDMAALERVWFRVHGCNPPDSPIALENLKETEAPEPRPSGPGVRSAADLGIQSAGRMDAMHRSRKKRSELTDDQKKARKAEYMKEYFAKRKAAGKESTD